LDLQHQFEVAAPVEDAWQAFLDMPRVAPCLPGAEVTEVVDERNVKGAAKIKVGPVNLRFAGQAEMTEIDDANRSATLIAKGSDAKGRGNADADIRFCLTEIGEGRTLVDVHTALTLTGSVAQYGRASGLVDEIANQVITEFVTNLETELARDRQVGPEGAVGEMKTTESAPPEPRPARPASALVIFFRALAAMVKKWLRRS
jgi:hypothetical protein